MLCNYKNIQKKYIQKKFSDQIEAFPLKNRKKRFAFEEKIFTIFDFFIVYKSDRFKVFFVCNFFHT